MSRASDRRFVQVRAGERGEYCGLRQAHAVIRLQVEHVIAVQHGGNDDTDNLALACAECNSHKGPNLSGIDPDTGNVERLFDPRRQAWAEHFERVVCEIRGLTPTGRATVRVLDMNAVERTRARQERMDLGLE